MDKRDVTFMCSPVLFVPVSIFSHRCWYYAEAADNTGTFSLPRLPLDSFLLQDQKCSMEKQGGVVAGGSTECPPLPHERLASPKRNWRSHNQDL